jgi:tetratricopeptide (TPR) repeat protein
MRNKFWQLLLLFFVFHLHLLAQKSAIYTQESKDFDKAVSLFKARQYVSAQFVFQSIKATTTNAELKSDCSYYIANCAIRTNQPNAEVLMERFVADFPTSRKQNQAFMEVARYYFTQGNYPQALEWFEKVEENNLSIDDLDAFHFQKAYSYFSVKDKKQATLFFNKVIHTMDYGSQAKYYLGFMAYDGDEYQKAAKYFDEVSGEEKYKEKLSYYQADMNFKLGNFQKAIELGTKALPKSNAMEQSELNKIIGESYFNLKQYEKSIPYLELYKGKKGKWNNTDFYQLGYAYYMQKQFENAVSQFNKILNGKDFVAQNAYYHLGESYLNLNKKTQALHAFKNAMEMDFDKSLQEDANLNYAKLSYEIGNPYQSTPAILTEFLKKYPANANSEEMERLLIDSFISSRNYKEALVLLDKNKAPENRLAYQKVTFYRGLELFSAKQFEEAAILFDKSLRQQKDTKFTARATFWKAETEYVFNDFSKAIISYLQFQGIASATETPEYLNVNYHIAYAYLKQKEYQQAAIYFQNQIENNKKDIAQLNDSYLRLADCLFVTSKFSAALDGYTKVIELKTEDSDYAYFQKTMCYGFVSNNNKKIEALNAFLKIYPKSTYRDDAYFELGNAYVTENKTDLAVKTYDQLITEFPNSAFTAKAILRQGLVYYNSDRNEQALTKFKKVAADYPKSPEALEAVSTARLIYVDNGKVDEYASWVRTLDFVTVTDAELDNDSFEAAEKQYLLQNTKQAIIGWNNYLSRFPNGIHTLKANFYLAQSFYSDGQESKSITNYEFVIAQPTNEFTEHSLVRLAQIYLKNQEIIKAIPVLSRLEKEANVAQNKTFTLANLMKSYYEIKDYSKAVQYAEKVMEYPKIDENVKNDAQIVIARSAFQTGDEIKSRSTYEKLQKNATGELAAEALYFDAYFKNKEGKFESSNVVVQKLAKNYSSNTYYGSKGLVLMAKNFYGLKDSFQATYILESVIKNFTDFPEVVSEAQRELEFIKSQEAKTNSSIEG